MTNNNLPHKFTTRDGRTVTIRSIEESDTALLVDLWHHLSDRTRRMRFHTLPKELPPQEIWRRAAELAHLQPCRQVAVVGTIRAEDGEHAVGVARLSRVTPDATVAETAVVVRDDFQHVGLGTHLLRTLGDVALTMGITQFEAWVLAENEPVLEIITKFGYPVHMETSRGETHVLLDIAPENTV